MIFPYMSFPDGTEVVHTHILNENTNPTIEVNFERPTKDGFDSARCELPSYKWIEREGNYSDEEIKEFEIFLHNNAHLIFKFARKGGICA